MQLAKVLNPTGASAKSASNVGVDPSHTLQDMNKLKHFVCAFPTASFHKRPRLDD